MQDVSDFIPSGVLATGYIRDEAQIQRVQAQIAIACSAGPGISGSCKRAIAKGVHYHNLTSYLASLIAKGGFVFSKRKLIDCGPDGKILEPLGQQTGICDGCSFGEAVLVSWAAKWETTKSGPRPRECSFLWPYLAGRDMGLVPRGDSGAIPPLSAELYHSVGAMPVDLSGPWDLLNKPPHGKGSQEELCIALRDTPTLPSDLVAAVQNYRCVVYDPRDAWDVADCLESLRAVTFGCSGQAQETRPGGTGISSLYRLGGHETFASGWFTWKGRLGFIKTESWWNVLYPGSQWPNHRVVIQTDDGPKTLYPGQCALWADEWMTWQPECWAIDAPGSRK